MDFVDAPVSGGVPGATNGTLSFMIGSPTQQLYKDTSEVLKYMGENLFDCKGVGMG